MLCAQIYPLKYSPMDQHIISRGAEIAVQYRLLVQMLLCAIAPLVLLAGRMPYSIRSHETMLGVIDPYKGLMLDGPLEFVQRPPHETICVVLNGNLPGLEERIKRLRLRTRSVMISQVDVAGNFFVKLSIGESDRSCVMLRPLQSIQPNSDFVALALRLFEGRLSFDVRDCFANGYDNTVRLALQNTEAEQEMLLVLLRYYMNVEAFTWCNYFYVPFPAFYIMGESVAGFIAAVFAMALYECDLRACPLSILWRLIVYAYAPALAPLLSRRDINGLLLVLFSMINIKMGCVFALLCYARTLLLALLGLLTMLHGRRSFTAVSLGTTKRQRQVLVGSNAPTTVKMV
ncbi:hypothetical protein PAPHI01_1912 [Pancytospora philotis]|nr:hypothetical protein PAPHI01_1912 [Pancytospora philotis]